MSNKIAFNPFTGNFDYTYKQDDGSVWKEVTQPGHGFSVLKCVYNDGTSWKLAKADAPSTMSTFVVIAVNGDKFTVMKFGVVKTPNHNLVVGDYYFCSDTVAGDLDINEGSLFSNPVLKTIDNETLEICVHRPSSLTPKPKEEFANNFLKVTQVGHNLSEMDCVYFDGNEWGLAKSDDDETLGSGIIVAVDGDDITIGLEGVFDMGTHGLVVGDYYFCSNLTAGALIITEPVSGYSNPMIQVLSSRLIRVLNLRPFLI